MMPEFIEVPITEAMLKRAEKRAQRMGALHNSFLRGGGNLTGFLGESMFRAAFKGSKIMNTRGYDVKFRGQKWEIKTKRCKFKPLANYEVSVTASSQFQKADYYVFVRLLDNYAHGWLLGYAPCERFRAFATHHFKGDVDKRNNFIFPVNCYNMRIERLRDISKL